MRICTKCKQNLEESCFNVNRARKDGLTTWCKNCQNEYNLKRKLKLKIEVKHKICTSCKQDLDISKYSLNSSNIDGHETRCKDCQRNNIVRINYYQKRKTEIKPKITHKVCTKCLQDLDIINFHKNINIKDGYNNWCRFCQQDYDKQYYIDTKDSRRDKRRENSKIQNKKIQDNPILKLNQNMSSNIYKALKGLKAERHWEDLVGYTLEELKEHIESQFTPEMNWNNQGTYWEIDHIIPKNMFNYTTANDKDFKICWSLMNLRPLSNYDNIHRPRKGQDIPEELKQQILNQKVPG